MPLTELIRKPVIDVQLIPFVLVAILAPAPGPKPAIHNPLPYAIQYTGSRRSVGWPRPIQVIPSVEVANKLALSLRFDAPNTPPTTHSPLLYATQNAKLVKALFPRPVHVIPSVLVIIVLAPPLEPTATHNPLPYAIPYTTLKSEILRPVQVIPSELIVLLFPSVPPAIHNPLPYAMLRPKLVIPLATALVQLIPSVLLAILFPPKPTTTYITGISGTRYTRL